MIGIKDKFVIYGCGGMGLFGKDRFDESNEWRVDLKQTFEEVSDGKVIFINLNDHFNFLDRTTYDSEREIMDYDLYRVRNSDLIITNFNDPKSIGSACEMAIAHEKRIPIIGLRENNEELHPWLTCFCNRIFTDREELKLYVIDHYIKGD